MKWLMMLILAAGSSWEISWVPVADNIVLMVTTDCDQQHPFRAISRYTIGPFDAHALVYRVTPPSGAFCYVSAEIIAGIDGDDTSERVTQSATTTIQG